MVRSIPKAARRRSWSVVATLLLALAPEVASAQSAENKAAARSIGIEGIKLANEGNCEAAIERLQRAEELYHAPTILGRLGECQVEVGKLVEGTENLNRVVREPLPANAPDAYREARDRAQGVLDRALPKIGKLKIMVEPKVDGLVVRVEDKVVPAALIGAERPTDPGTHHIVAEAPGYLPATAEVTLPEGGAQSVSLSLITDPSAAVAPVPPDQGATESTTYVSTTRPPDTSPKKKDNTLAYVLWGVGGAGLATGAVTGVLALGKKGELEDDCPEPSNCPESSEDTIDSAKTMALISTIGFGVGIAGAAAGTILFFTGSDSSTGALEFEAYGTTARPYVTPSSVGFTGAF